MATARKLFVGRGGMSVDERGTEKILGYWPATLSDRSSTGYVGRAWNLYSAAMRVAQRHHEKNRKVIEAKAARQQPVLPEPAVRAALARQEQKQLAELKAENQRISDAAFLQKAILKPFTYTDNVVDAMNRAELRSIMRSLTVAERMKLAEKKFEYRRAPVWSCLQKLRVYPRANTQDSTNKSWPSSIQK